MNWLKKTGANESFSRTHKQKANSSAFISVCVLIGLLYADVSQSGDGDYGDVPTNIPVWVKEPSKKVLSNCPLDDNSRFKSTLTSLNSSLHSLNHPTPLSCSGQTEANDATEATRKLLYDLRKVREKELYQIEALNSLLYVPDDFFADDKSVTLKLEKSLCERASIATRSEFKAAIADGTINLPAKTSSEVFISAQMKPSNDCQDPNSEISKMISAAANGAIADFKSKNLRKPTSQDLSLVNQELQDLRSACDHALPSMNGLFHPDPNAIKEALEEFAKRDQTSKNGPNLFKPEDFDFSSKKTKKQIQTEAEKKQGAIEQSNFLKEVYPIIVKIFSSPYGRLLANSTYLQGKIGLSMDADWTKPEFCYGLPSHAPVTLGQTDINTGYFGSPSQNILGVRATLRENIGDLLTTRIPSLRDHFWKPVDKSSFLQSDEAKVQQQVTYELLYNASDEDVKRLIQANPLYAELACRSLQHESFWERGDIRAVYKWAKPVMTYGGMATGFVSGFFTGGGGWVIAGSIAAGLATTTVGTGLELKSALDAKKEKVMNQVANTQRAIVDQGDIQNGDLATNKTEDKINIINQIQKQTPADQAQIEKYIKEFTEAEATRNVEDGRTISKAISPEALKTKLIREAGDAKSEALVSLAYNYATTIGGFGIAKGLQGLAIMAKAKNLTTLEDFSTFMLKLESGHVTPTDVANAVGSCLVLKDCSTTGIIMGAAMKGAHTSLGKIFSGLKNLKGNSTKTQNQLISEIAEGIVKESNNTVKKEDVIKQLQLALNSKASREVAQNNSTSENAGLKSATPTSIKDQTLNGVTDENRSDFAAKMLGYKNGLSQKQADALAEAHIVGRGEAEKGSYTRQQLKEKIQILRDGGFSDQEVNVLLRKGLAGDEAGGAGLSVVIPRTDSTQSIATVIKRFIGQGGKEYTRVEWMQNGQSYTKDVPTIDLKYVMGNKGITETSEVIIPRSDGSKSIGKVVTISDGNARVTWTEKGNTYTKTLPVSSLTLVSNVKVAVHEPPKVADASLDIDIGESVSVRRTDGSYSNARVKNVASNGNITVEFIENGNTYSKTVMPSSIQQSIPVSSGHLRTQQQVSIQTSSGSVENGTVVGFTQDGKAVVETHINGVVKREQIDVRQVMDPISTKSSQNIASADAHNSDKRSNRNWASQKVEDYVSRGGQVVEVNLNSPELTNSVNKAVNIIEQVTGIAPGAANIKDANVRRKIYKAWLEHVVPLFEDQVQDHRYADARDRILSQNGGHADLGVILNSRAAVCRELSVAGSVVFSEYGIPSKVVTGNVRANASPGGHAWIQDDQGTIVDNNYLRDVVSSFGQYAKQVDGAVVVKYTTVVNPQ